jgi:hypothetical protein
VIVPDVNLLLYAYAARFPHHGQARDWWAACLSGREPVGLSHVVMFAFIRIGTNGRISDNPMTLDAGRLSLAPVVNRTPPTADRFPQRNPVIPDRIPLWKSPPVWKSRKSAPAGLSVGVVATTAGRSLSPLGTLGGVIPPVARRDSWRVLDET